MLGAGTTLLTKDAFPDGNHYNSTRLPVSDRLDSSPLEFEFAVSQSFLGALRRAAKSNSAPNRRRDASALAAALRHLVSCEIVYYDGSPPMIFVEDDDASPGSYRLSHLPACRLVDVRVEEASRRLYVSVDRKFPLSSSHGGRRFRLAFVVDTDVVTTEAFTVFAKKAKIGVGCKFVHKPKELAVDAGRAARLAAVQAAVSEHHAVPGMVFPDTHVPSPHLAAAAATAAAPAVDMHTAGAALSLPAPALDVLGGVGDMPVPEPAARLRSLPFNDILTRALDNVPPEAVAPVHTKRAEHPIRADGDSPAAHASAAKRVRCGAAKPAFDGTITPDTIVGGDDDVARAVWAEHDDDDDFVQHAAAGAVEAPGPDMWLLPSAVSPLTSAGFEVLGEEDFLDFLNSPTPAVQPPTALTCA